MHPDIPVPNKSVEIFRRPSLFQKYPPEEIRKRDGREPRSRGLHTEFAADGLWVKWGRSKYVSIVEGQCAWYMRQKLPEWAHCINEVFGWWEHDGYTFLYLEYVQGPTFKQLDDHGEWCSKEDRVEVCDQLVAFLRAYRRAIPTMSQPLSR